MNCDKNDLLLYAVTDRHWLDGRRLIDVVRESLDGGVTMVQLREKTLEEGKFLEEAKELQTLCRERGVPFLVNDNVEIAREMNADGVHVGQSDMEAQDVRAILGPDKILGVSAQTVEQAVLAEKHGADYLGVGAVFPTCLLYTSSSSMLLRTTARAAQPFRTRKKRFAGGSWMHCGRWPTPAVCRMPTRRWSLRCSRSKRRWRV